MKEYFYGRPENQGSPEHAIGIFAAHESLHSEKTSSLPLVQFWCTKKEKEFTSRLASFKKCTGIDIDNKGCQLCFEYSVPAQGGKGKASMTDLMIITPTHAIAVEAKYTEVNEKPETIGTWLKAGEKSNSPDNRKQVLQGWWDYIREMECTTEARIDQLTGYEDIPYQLLHRIASACRTAHEKTIAAVIYQIFYDNETREKAQAFAANLLKNYESLHLNCEKLTFKIVLTETNLRDNDILGKLPVIIKDGKSEKDYSELFVMMLKDEPVYKFSPSKPFPLG